MRSEVKGLLEIVLKANIYTHTYSQKHTYPHTHTHPQYANVYLILLNLAHKYVNYTWKYFCKHLFLYGARILLFNFWFLYLFSSITFFGCYLENYFKWCMKIVCLLVLEIFQNFVTIEPKQKKKLNSTNSYKKNEWNSQLIETFSLCIQVFFDLIKDISSRKKQRQMDVKEPTKPSPCCQLL